MIVTRAPHRISFSGGGALRPWILSRYPHPLLTPTLNLAHRLSPPPLREAMFPITFGEQLVRASKPNP
jgi:hypothetical protein